MAADVPEPAAETGSPTLESVEVPLGKRALAKSYCDTIGARFAPRMKAYLPQLEHKAQQRGRARSLAKGPDGQTPVQIGPVTLKAPPVASHRP